MFMKKIICIIILIFTSLLFVGCQNASFSISIGYKKLEMLVGETYVLSTNYEDLNEEGKVEWRSSDESIASVVDGEVIALKEGVTYISAVYNEHESKIYLVVKGLDSKRSIKISGTQMVLIGKTTSLTSEVGLEEGETIIWSSSDEKVATVDENGTVTGVKTGLVVIRASLSSDASIYADTNILVRAGDGTQDVIINKIINETYDYTGNTDLTSFSNKIVDTVSNVKDSVIGVSNYKKSNSSYSLQGVGSGVIYEKEDLGNGTYKYTLLTNYHVIEKQDVLKVYIGGTVDKEYDATLLKTNKNDDLAIVSFVYDKEITPVTFAEEDETVVGDFVIAIGNPNGYDYYNSVTFGITSYVNREVSGETASFVQHDAAINPGNSGGALFNIDGKLIGINTMKIAKVTVEGMGFAIDLKTVNAFINADE